MAVRGEKRLVLGGDPIAITDTSPACQEVLLNTRLQVAKGNWGSPHIAGDVGVFAGRIEFDRRQRVVLVSVNVLVFVDVRGGGVKFRSNVPGVLLLK
jgi:hypothetical protein